MVVGLLGVVGPTVAVHVVVQRGYEPDDVIVLYQGLQVETVMVQQTRLKCATIGFIVQVRVN